MLKTLKVTIILSVVVLGLIFGLLLAIAGIEQANGLRAFTGLILTVVMFKVLSYLK